MVINLRGTSGAGKSTIVRKLMGQYTDIQPKFHEGRKRPYGYLCAAFGFRSLFVVGHYEIPCGGCDTIVAGRDIGKDGGVMDTIYGMVREHHELGENVIFEGLIVESDVKRMVALHTDGFPVNVIALDVPIETCLESVKLRRTARGDERELDPTNTVNRVPQIIRRMQRLQEAGVNGVWLNREAALAKCLELLRISGDKPAWEPTVEEQPPKVEEPKSRKSKDSAQLGFF